MKDREILLRFAALMLGGMSLGGSGFMVFFDHNVMAFGYFIVGVLMLILAFTELLDE